MKKLGLFALAVLVVVLLFTLIGGRGEDGGLIGGASLQCDDFVQILDAADQ